MSLARPAASPASALEERDRALELLRRFGGSPESFCFRYEAPWCYVFGEEVEGGAVYIRSHGTAIVWGDPLCPPESRGPFLEELTEALRGRGLRLCLLLLGEEFARLALSAGFAVLKIGEQPVVDVPTWRGPRGNRGKRLRWSVNRARREGLRVEEYRAATGRSAKVEAEVLGVLEAWEHGLHRPAARSFLKASPLTAAEDKRIFLVRGTRAEAVLACAPVLPGRDWYLEDLVRRPEAPTGATELLVAAALEQFAREGVGRVYLDIAPLRGSGAQLDPRARWLAPALRMAFEHFDARYHFASMSRYVEKFLPSEWQARYVAILPPRPSIGLIRAVRSAL